MILSEFFLYGIAVMLLRFDTFFVARCSFFWKTKTFKYDVYNTKLQNKSRKCLIKKM